MAVTGLNRWDFFSYCPGETPLSVKVLRNDTTELVLEGLKTMVREKAKMESKLHRIWEAGKGEG